MSKSEGTKQQPIKQTPKQIATQALFHLSLTTASQLLSVPPCVVVSPHVVFSSYTSSQRSSASMAPPSSGVFPVSNPLALSSQLLAHCNDAINSTAAVPFRVKVGTIQKSVSQVTIIKWGPFFDAFVRLHRKWQGSPASLVGHRALIQTLTTEYSYEIRKPRVLDTGKPR